MLKVMNLNGLMIMGNLEGGIIKEPFVLAPQADGKVAFLKLPCSPKEVEIHVWGVAWDPNEDFRNTYVKATTGLDLTSKIIPIGGKQ